MASNRTSGVSPVLTVDLLGPPVVELAGRPVGFDTRKAVAVLALLAVEPGGRTRAALADMFWPDSDPARSRSALRRTLSVLGAGIPGHLTSAGGSVALDGARRVDVTEFRAAAADGAATSAALHRTAALWRDEFMAGFSVRGCPDFDDWQSAQAEALRQELGAVLDRLVDALVVDHRLDHAVEPARRRLALDGLHEPAHQTLMRLYSWAGQRSAALRQYRDCVRVLDRELGVAPLAETTRIYEAICADTLPGPPTRPAAARPRVRLPSRRLHPVGRAPELDRLTTALSSADGPGVRVACVLGPVGMGKSVLLRAFADMAAGFGSPVRCTRCHPAAAGLPFAAVDGLLGPGAATAAVGSRGAAAAALVQSAPAAAAPTVVIVDDAQWCDDSSAEVLRLLLSAPGPHPLLLLTAWDPARLDRPAAAELLAAQQGAPDALVLELSALTLDDMHALLAGAGLPAPPRLADRLLAATGGLPLLVGEYVAALRDGVVVADPDKEWELPTTVPAVLRLHLDRVSDTCAQVLTAAAVLGGPADPGLLRTVSGRSEEETVDGVEEAVARGLLVEATGTGGYELPHEALQRVVYDAASLARRRLLHGRAARELARRGAGPVDPGAVAAHFEAAGEEQEAAGWAWQAAERARGLGANAEALAHLRVATALGPDRTDLHEATGDVLTALGRYRDAVAAYERAAAGGDGSALAGVEHKLAEVYQRLGDWRVAEVHLAAALALVDESDAAHRARLRADTALLAYRRGALADAATAANAAVAEATAAGDDAAIAQAADVLAVLAVHDGRWDDAGRLLTQSLTHAVRAGDVGLRVAALNNLAHLHAVAGAPDEAVSVAREALAAGLEHGDKHHCAALHANLADALHRAGRDGEAREHLTEAASLFGQVDERLHRPEIWKLSQW